MISVHLILIPVDSGFQADPPKYRHVRILANDNAKKIIFSC